MRPTLKVCSFYKMFHAIILAINLVVSIKVMWYELAIASYIGKNCNTPVLTV